MGVIESTRNMQRTKEQEKLLQAAKDQVKRIQIFYLHLILYIIVVGLILHNFYIMVEGPYTDNITALNISILVLWTACIAIHGWRVFKGKLLFKKSWEDRKIKEILDKESEKVTHYE